MVNNCNSPSTHSTHSNHSTPSTAAAEKPGALQDLESQTPVDSTALVPAFQQSGEDEKPKDPNLVSTRLAIPPPHT